MSRRLFKSTFIFSFMTTISRVFGLIRDVVIATFFGASVGTDVFFVAFKIPNYLRRLFAEGAFSQAFVPVLSEYKSQRSEAEARQLINHVTGTLGLVLLGVTVIGVIAAPVLIMIFAPGFIGDETRFGLAVDMLRITFPYILFISLTALAGGILNTWGRFAVPAFTPVLLNLSLILSAIYLTRYMPAERQIMALAWGVFIAGVVQLLFQFPFLLRLRLLPRPQPQRTHEGVRRIVTLMIPTLFAVSVSQINLMIDLLIASFLQTGSITWLYYSDRLMEFPLGVFGVALATVILPDLSREFSSGSFERFSHKLDWALRWTLLISLPAALGLIFLSGQSLTTLFNYGEFTTNDVNMASRSLVAYAIGLCGFILIKVFSSGYFSRQDTRTPVKIAVVAMATNIILSLALVFPLAHAGLALATSLAAFVNAGLLFYFLKKKGAYAPQRDWPVFFARVGCACVAMSLLLFLFVPKADTWMQWSTVHRVTELAIWIGLAMLVYFAVLRLSGLRLRQMTLDAE